MIAKFIKNRSLIRQPPSLVLNKANVQPSINGMDEFPPSPYTSARDFYDKLVPPIHIDENKFPLVPTDIKGVDSGTYQFIHRQKAFSKQPGLARSEFIQLKYFPDFHYLSLSRKSNIALGNFNESVPIMNDHVLAKALETYRGPLEKLNYFKKRSNPLTKATARAKFRKLVKSSLLDSICKSPEISLVRGFYFYKINKVPETDQDKVQLANDIDKSIQKVIHDENYRRNLIKVSKQMNKLGLAKDLIKSVQLHNTLNETRLPQYQPKLPFINNKNRLV